MNKTPKRSHHSPKAARSLQLTSPSKVVSFTYMQLGLENKFSLFTKLNIISPSHGVNASM